MHRILTLACLLPVLVACGREEAPPEAPSESAPPFELSAQGEGASIEFMTPKGTPRTIDFTTDEGTWMTVDVSPDGQWILFDLLGHIYRMPAEGGEAICLTQGSGIALNFHPAYSPDGSRIAFISDRSGQDNVWVMDADGSNPRALFLDEGTRFSDPEWHPDGRSVTAVRIFPSPGRGWHRRNMTLSRISVDEGVVTEIQRDQLAHFTAPTFSPDGQHMYFEVAYSTWRGNGLLKAGHRIQRQDLQSGALENARLDEPAELSEDYIASLSKTTYAQDLPGDNPAELSPEVSPDGRWLAFGLEQQQEMLRYRGHEYRGTTGIVVRDIQTGEEKLLVQDASRDLTLLNAQYSYRPFPGLAWTPQSDAVIAAYGGKIHRIDIATGNDSVIPFTARIKRTLSEQVRSRISIKDQAFKTRFMQWPSSSPVSDQLVFVAAGRLWQATIAADTARAEATALTPDPGDRVQLTPDFSADGRWVVYATWSNSEGGHLWLVEASGGEPRRLTSEAAQYLYPAFSSDGSKVLVTRGPNQLWPTFASDGPALNQETAANDAGPAWQLVTVDIDSGEPTPVVPLAQPRRGVFLASDRVAAYGQDNIAATFDLRSPYPNEAALSQVVRIKSWDAGGGDETLHALFPPRLDFFGGSNHPLLSPDARHVAFESGGAVFTASLSADHAAEIEPDPNLNVPGRERIGAQGGIYPHWIDEGRLEFVSGDLYLRYDVATGRQQTVKIDLSIPRDVPQGTIALTGARIITIDGDRVIESGDIVIDGARISCVGACDTSSAERTIDATGKTIIPGLIDLHAHHTRPNGGIVTQHSPDLALDLAYGVTTIVDPATSSRGAFPLAEMVEAGVLAGPRVYSSAEFVITQALAWGDNLVVDSAENGRFNAQYRARWGAAELKNYRLAARQHHQYLIEAAREIPITVTAEGGPLYADVGFTMDGQTGWEHLIGPMRLYRDATEFFGRAGIHYSPTVIVAGHVNGAKDYYRQSQGLLEDPKYNRFIPRGQLEAQHRHLPDWPKSEFSFPLVAEGMKDIIRAGGYGVLGEHGEQVGIGTHWELWAYAEALTPLEALTVGSLHGAHYIGLENETGSIKAGKLADLVVLNSNPLDDIRNSADIALVIKAGNIYNADTLDRIWPDERAFGPAPWWQRDQSQ